MQIETLLDACEYVLQDLGEAQSSFWLASQMDEMKLWRASEFEVRAVLEQDIQKNGESSRFKKVGEDEFVLRSWKTA